MGEGSIQDIKAKCEEDIEIGREGTGPMFLKGNMPFSRGSLKDLNALHTFTIRSQLNLFCSELVTN